MNLFTAAWLITKFIHSNTFTSDLSNVDQIIKMILVFSTKLIKHSVGTTYSVVL